MLANTVETNMSSAEQCGQLPELLEMVLAQLPPRVLLSTATGVNRQWRQLVCSSESIWCQHVHPALMQLPSHPKQLPASTMQAGNESGAPDTSTTTTHQRLPPNHLYLAVHASNLLRNPSLSRAASLLPAVIMQRAWEFKVGEAQATYEGQTDGNPPPTAALAIPPPPYPYITLPAKPGVLGRLARMLTRPQPDPLGYLATGAQWTEVVQVVDLERELTSRGLTQLQAAAVLDQGLPLGFSVQVASHPAHAAGIAVCVLLDDGASKNASTQVFVQRSSNHLFFSGYRSLPQGSGWQRFAHTVDSVPPGCRRAMVMLRGRAVEDVGGHGEGMPEGRVGPRWASVELRLLTPGEAQGWGSNSGDESTWPNW